MDFDWGLSSQMLYECSVWNVFVYLGNCVDLLLFSDEAPERYWSSNMIARDPLRH